MHEIFPYVFIAVVGVVAGVLSGMSGGGGGMLMVPAYIFAGLPPQQAVATGKMNGLGAAFGGLSVFAKSGLVRKDILKVMLPVAVVVGVVTPFIFRVVDSQIFQIILGLVLILLTPTLFIKKKPVSVAGKQHRALGYLLYSVILTIQALFGSGVGSLALFILTLLFGTSKLEANATKRAVTAVLTPLTFIGLLASGFVVLSYGFIGLAATFVGTHFGSKIAIKKGEGFVTMAMAVTIVASGATIILQAI